MNLELEPKKSFPWKTVGLWAVLTILAGVPILEAVAPYGFKGLFQTATQYSNVLQFPNAQVTKMSGINSLVETGNTNLLVNPSFEAATATTGWTTANGSPGAELTVKINGKQSLVTSPSATTFSVQQSSTINSAQMAGVQFLAMVRVRTNQSGVQVCSVNDGTVSTVNCASVNNDSNWGIYKVPFIGTTTSNGIWIGATGSVTGNIYIDDAFVGPVDLKTDSDSSKVAGESYFAGTASCQWSRTSTSVGAFTSSATCPGPTIVYSTMGAWATTDSDLPRQTITNLPAGTYKATFYTESIMGASANPAFSITDGTTTCEPVAGSQNASAAAQQIVACTFVYTAPGTRVFELYGGSTSSSIAINNLRASPRSSTKFILEYFGSGSVYTATNADYGTTAFTATGSWTTNSTYAASQWRDGEYLNVVGSITLAGAPTSASLTINIPSGLTIDSSKIPAFSSNAPIGVANYLDAAVQYYAGAVVTNNTTSVALYYSIASASNTAYGATTQANPFTWGTGDVVMYSYRVPIVGWTKSNIIIGTFNEVMTAPGISKPKTCYASYGGASATLAAPTVCSTGTCVEVYDSCNAVTPPSFSTTGRYVNATFANGTFANTSSVYCTCKSYSTSAESRCDNFNDTGNTDWATSSSGGAVLDIGTDNSIGVATNSFFQIKCEGLAP